MPWDKHGAPRPPAASACGWGRFCQSLKDGKQTLLPVRASASGADQESPWVYRSYRRGTRTGFAGSTWPGVAIALETAASEVLRPAPGSLKPVSRAARPRPQPGSGCTAPYKPVHPVVFLYGGAPQHEPG